MLQYADIHTHILPGVDDGAKDESIAIEMLKQEASIGARLVFLTPHYISGKSEYKADELKKRFEAFKELSQVKDIGIDLRLGSELYYTKGLITDLLRGDALTMDGTSRILIEFPRNTSSLDIMSGCRRLYNSGYRPILAHIERYENFNETVLSVLMDMDIQFQMNSSYVKTLNGILTGDKRWHKKLLSSGAIDYVSSDTHNTESRRPDLAAEFIEKRFPKRANRLLWENANALKNTKEN